MGEFRKSLCTSGESHRLRKKKNTQEDLFTLQADYWHRTKNNQRNRIKLNQLKKENKKKTANFGKEGKPDFYIYKIIRFKCLFLNKISQGILKKQEIMAYSDNVPEKNQMIDLRQNP